MRPAGGADDVEGPATVVIVDGSDAVYPGGGSETGCWPFCAASECFLGRFDRKCIFTEGTSSSTLGFLGLVGCKG